ncbi:MAG: hypothetical protein ACRDTA_02730 [Pseudonocardiaceae bacterium]
MPSGIGAQVLAAAVPVLTRNPTAFKVPATMSQLRRLVVRDCDRAQAGKVVTIYPDDDEQFVRLAVELHEVTAAMVGPRSRSDRPCRPGSRVHMDADSQGTDARDTLRPRGVHAPAARARTGQNLRSGR